MAFLEALFRLVLSLSFAGGAGTLLVLGAKALRQSTVVIPAVDEFISSYM